VKRVAGAGLLSGFIVLSLLVLSGCGTSAAPPIAVGLTPSSTQSIDQAQTVPITAAVAHDPKTAGVTWAVSGGGTLTNTSTASATYDAPASVTTVFTATVTATSVSDATKIATLQIKVAPLPAITTTTLTATAGSAYNGTVSESGGTSPYTFAITSGSLPPGLSLNSSTGAITGMPTGPAANSSVTFQVTDAAKMSASQAVAVTINAPPALTITTGSLPAGTTGTAYNQTLQATGGVPSYTWAVTTGSLPSGLNLNSATGVISGTPSGTFTGTTSFTVTATDSQTPTHATTTANLGITVSAPPLSVTTTSLVGGTIGNAYAGQTLQATGGISPYRWAVTAGSLPAGLSLNAATGVISGTPTGTFVGTVNFTVTATDSETPTAKTANANLSIAISVAPLSVTTSGSLAVGVVSSQYSGATLQATGGITPYSWAVTTGSLPAGLTLNAATGAISGTPTASGTANFTVTVTDSETPTAKTATANLSIVVDPALSVTTNSLPAGVIGTSYSQTLAAAGGITPYTWSITTGSLPTGLSLNASTGAISGTPSGTFTGTVSFTVTVTDNESPTKKSASANLGIVISAPPLSVTTQSLAGGTIGNVYTNQTLQATGGIAPYTWAVTTGSLPSGLSLNAATGVISGTPAGTFVGTDTFTVTVTDSETPTGGKASANLSIAISVAPLSVTTTSSSLPVGVVSSVYAGATLQATGGISPYTWSVTTGSLPAGLTLNTATGAISGTPTASGTTNFTVTVTDSETPTAKTATANLSIVVNPALSVTTTTLPAGVIGTAYPGATLAAAGGITPYTWSITTGSLPAGLSLNTNTGAISGTPSGTLTGTVIFTVTVTDNESPIKQTASANLSIVISATPLKVTTTSLAGGSVGIVYTNQTLQATGGITPYKWTVTTGSLPVGLSLNATTGVISGTPTGTFVGTDSFTVTATDSETPTSQTASANLSITISVASLSVTTTSSSFVVGVVNSVYPSTTLQATGGISPYTWAVTTGSLPAGLTLNGATGVISGIPTASGTTNFTVTVTDSETPTAKTATANLSIVVNPALSVTTTTLPAGVIGTAYPGATLAAAGGITPYTWAITTGSLPAGLSLNASTGAISGTPTGTFTGTVNFTVTVTDNESPTKQTASANLSIVVSATPLKVTTTSLAGGSVGVVYANQTLQATGGITPYSWTVTTGSLPSGLSLNASTGVISGTPTGTFVGTDSFTVTVTDSETPTQAKATASLSITISVASLSVTTTSSSFVVGVVNSVYPSTTLQATGGISPYTWAVTTGSLPAGLTLNGATGVISGTPTASGTANFTVTVTDSETPTAKTATANLSIVVNPALSVTTTSLAAGVIGTTYSQTLAASGGITPYTWTITTGSLPAGLSLNASTGAISGTPSGNFTGTTNFTVTVTDNESPTKKTAAANLGIAISAPALKVTTTSLPTGVLTNTYSATLQASGGVQSYSWQVTAGSLPPGLSLTSTGCGSNVKCAITGTPTTTGTYNFTVTVTDSETPTAQTASANLSISVNNSAPLAVITSGLPAGVVNTPYQNGVLQANGGVQPYTWSISAGSLPAGLILNASTGAITGTPTATGTSNFTVKVTDSTQPTPETATANLSITINGALAITTTSVPDGSVNSQYNATVNAAGGLQPYSWSIISGNLPPGLSLNNNNTLTISGQPTTTGTYPFTLQVTDNENPQVSVSNGYTIVIGTQPPGYTVSGNVGYSGSKTGWTYLQLTGNNNNCCGNNLGTSISETVLTSGGAFTIHGVQPGTYTLQAFMDNLGYGAENASNPTGSVANITVVNSPVTGVSIVLADPSPVSLSTAPSWNANNGNGAFNGGAFVSFQTIKNNNGIEMPASYTVQWSTTSSFTSIVGSKSFPATGNNNPWIVNGLTNGQILYFRAQGVAGSSTSSWSSPSSAMTIGAPTAGNTVSGTVSFSETATGPLYVGFYNQSTGAVYVDVVGSKTSPPKSPASYTVQVPTGSDYFFVGILDQNNSGLLTGPGQVTNTNGNNQAPVSITGNMTNEDLTLPSGNSTATVQTQAWEQINSNGTNTYYNIGFNVNGLVKLPVAVELATGPALGVVIPADIASGGFYGNSDQFSYWANLNGATPQVGDTYTLNVTYSDGTSEVLTVTVTAVLNAFATNLSPQGSGVSMTPNFGWTDPQNASSYTYQFQLWDQNGNSIWQIPSNNSNSNGFSSSITSITWGVDPTGSGDLPNVSSLNGSSNYNWQITAKDVNGNSAGVQVTFQTAAAPLTLPAPGSVGSTVVGQSWSGAINASGGIGPNYTFTVNGTLVPTDGTQVSLGDNLYAWNTGGNTLSLGGTPTAIQTVSFTVSVTDSASDTAGPYTYTIGVTAAAPLTIQTTTLPGGDKGWPYNTSLQASGGVQPYTWSFSGTLPAGLSVTNNNGNGSIGGTPTAAGTSPFTITVTDSALETASASVSIVIGDCGNNANLKGNYALMVNGWKSTNDATSAVGSFVADGAGNISSGSLDSSDQISGPTTGTLTGTYCVNSDNLALLTVTPTGGSTLTLAAALDASDGNGHIISYDPNNTELVSGLLRKQTPSAFSTSKISGNYAFGFVGADQGSNRFGIAGEFNSNGSGTLTGSADFDDSCSGGGCTGNVGTTNLTASDFLVASSTTGRGTVSIFVSTPNVTVPFVFYVVSSTEVLMMAADNTESPSMIMAGQVLQQSGTFTDASLNGISVIELQGVGNNGGSPEAAAGFVTTNGSGTISINADQNQGGTMGTICGSGTYSVAPSGRMTLTSFTQCGGGGGGGHNPVFYLVAKNQAFVVGTDNSVTLGMMNPQVGSGFTVASLSGNYLGGSQETDDSNEKAQVIQIHADGAGNLTGTSAQNAGPNGCGGSCADTSSSTLVATYALYPGGPDGKFAISQDGVTAVYLYMISTTQAVILPVSSSENQSNNPSLADFHQ
jgi:hypothetical protein